MLVSGEKAVPMRGLALRVELEQLGGHVGHGLLDARLGLLPGLRAELVELRRGAGVGGAVLLDEVEASERDVELGLVGELEDHQLERRLVVLFDDAQAAVAGDAVFDVDDVVADGEVAEVGDEGGGLWICCGVTGRAVTSASSVRSCAPKRMIWRAGRDFVEVEHLHAVGDGGLDDDGGAQVAGEVAGLGVDGGAAGGLRARAEAVGDLVLLQQAGEAFDFALIGRGDEDAGVLLHERC